MKPALTARDFVRKSTRTAVGVMLLGGGVAAGSLLLAVSGCFLLPLRRIADRAWRPNQAEREEPTVIPTAPPALHKVAA